MTGGSSVWHFLRERALAARGGKNRGFISAVSSSLKSSIICHGSLQETEIYVR